MAQSSWPTVAGGRAINDTQWEQMASGFAADGVVGAPTDTALVYADATGMQVKVRANKLALVRGHGWASGGAEFTKTIGANSSGSTRIDLIVLRLTRSTWDVTIEVKAGTPGAGVPALTQDATGSGAGVYEIAVAQVNVANGAATIAATDVTPLARFIGGASSSSRPKLYAHQPPLALSGNWTNTAAPTADDVSATGMFAIAGSRLTIDKQSPDSLLEVMLDVSGAVNGPGLVRSGVRVMATGYTSTNHIVGTFYFNIPLNYTTVSPNWQGPSSQGPQFTETDYPSTSVSGEHWHRAPTHTHNFTVPAIHMPWHGVIQIPSLSVKTYTIQPWFYVASGQTFTMDGNDHLVIRVAEV